MNSVSKVYKKGICVNNIEIDRVKELLAPFVGNRDDYSQFKLFRGIAYTNELDRDGEICTHQFLSELAPKLVGVPIIKNHDWSDVDGVVGRVVSAEYIADGDEQFIRILFYAVKSEDIDAINNGLYFGLSVGFSSKTDGNTLTNCSDAYEVSLVVVPAVPGAHITKSKTKESGGINMDELETLKAELEAVKAENEELKAKLAEIEQKEFEEEANEALEAKADEVAGTLEPANDTVKEYIVDELKSAGYEMVDNIDGATQLKCGKFISLKKLNDKVDEVKTKYTKLGLLGKVKETPKVEVKKEVKSLDFTAGETINKKSVNTGKRGMTVNFN